MKGILASILIYLSFSSLANDGVFYNQKLHGQWLSGSYKDNDGVYNARMLYQLDTTISSPVFIIDIAQGEKTYIYLVSPKPADSPKDSSGNMVPRNCAVRVDSKKQYNTFCLLVDRDGSIMTAISPDISDSIIKDSITGNYLRLKVELTSEPIYYQIDLTGFAEAYKRATSLKRDDADYFK